MLCEALTDGGFDRNKGQHGGEFDLFFKQSNARWGREVARGGGYFLIYAI